MKKRAAFIPIILALILSTITCDDTFTPVSEDYLDNYSVFGFLDAEADTQWIRIMPIKDTIDQSDLALPESVTLSTSDGQLIEMNPLKKVFIIQNKVKIVWNYWTDAPIDKDKTYLLQVVHPNGEITESEAHIPPDFATPELDGSLLSFGLLDTLADVRIAWKIRDHVNEETIEISFSEQRNVHWSMAREEFRGFINPNKSYLKIAELLNITDPYFVTLNGDLEILETKLLVVQAGEGWVDFFELDRDEIAVQTIQANVSNGVGYFVGTVIKKIPFPTCVGDAGDIVVCEGSSN